MRSFANRAGYHQCYVYLIKVRVANYSHVHCTICVGRELAVFGGVVTQMLEDVQQRIVFRAQRYIQTDIRGYNPAPGDLAYPDKLIVASEATAQEGTISDSDSVFDTSGTEVSVEYTCS